MFVCFRKRQVNPGEFKNLNDGISKIYAVRFSLAALGRRTKSDACACGRSLTAFVCGGANSPRERRD